MKYRVVGKNPDSSESCSPGGRADAACANSENTERHFPAWFSSWWGKKGHVQSTEHTNVCTHKPSSLCTCIHWGFKLNSKLCNCDLYRLEVGLDCN